MGRWDFCKDLGISLEPIWMFDLAMNPNKGGVKSVQHAIYTITWGYQHPGPGFGRQTLSAGRASAHPQLHDN